MRKQLKNVLVSSENKDAPRFLKYISDADASKSGVCKACLKNANRIFKWPEDADIMPRLPIHPNCRCRYEKVYENDMITCNNVKNLSSRIIKSSYSKIETATAEKMANAIIEAEAELISSGKIEGKETIFFYFNGRYLYSNNGDFVVEAVSGTPSKEERAEESSGFMGNRETTKIKKEFDYSKERQAQEGIGGIPEGLYSIHLSETRSPTTSPWSHIVKSKGWGTHSWSLHKDDATETFGRKGFFIHGGDRFGSAGCIDIKNNDTMLKKYLDDYGIEIVWVMVKYSENKVTTEESSTRIIPAPYDPLMEGMPY